MFKSRVGAEKIDPTVWVAGFLYFLFFLFSNFWLATTTYHSSYILVVYFCLSVIFTIPFIFLFILIKKIEFNYLNITLISLLWALFEWARLFFLSGFPFAVLGYFFSSVPLFQEIVGVIGIYGVSFVVVFAFLTLIKALFYKDRYALIYFLSFGFLCLITPANKLEEKKSASLKVFTVQPGTLVSQKTYSEEFQLTFMPLDEQLRLILDRLEAIIGKEVDLVVFPEGVLSGFIEQKNFSSRLLLNFLEKNHLAVPESFSNYSHLSQLEIFQILSKTLNLTIVFGGNRYDEEYNSYNSFIVVEPNQNAKFYDKRILVPMGESLPFKWLEGIAKRYGITGFYETGEESLMTVGEFKVLPSVCYEDCFPLFKWKNFTEKPDFLLNLTNDGWFFPSSLPKIHASLSRLRVLELGLPMIRACEQSQSGWIRADGVSFLFDEKNLELPILEVSLVKKHKIYFAIKENWLFIGLLLVCICKVKGIFVSLRFKLAQKRELV